MCRAPQHRCSKLLCEVRQPRIGTFQGSPAHVVAGRGYVHGLRGQALLFVTAQGLERCLISKPPFPRWLPLASSAGAAGHAGTAPAHCRPFIHTSASDHEH